MEINQICPGDEIFRKLRQVWTETQHTVCDEKNKGGQKLNYGLENLTIPYPCEPGTFTNWQNWIMTKPHHGTHLPATIGILAQFLSIVRKLWEVYMIKNSFMVVPSQILTIILSSNWNPEWGSPLTANLSLSRANNNWIRPNLSQWLASQLSQVG